MYIIGIDIGKNHHETSIVSPEGKQIGHSPYLRHAIFLAATTCSFHNSPLNAYYKKKRDQCKHHLTATGAVARKLTTIIYAVLRDSKPYEPKKFC